MNKLFKKSVAVIASMGVLATTVNVNAFAATTVNAEFTAAYEWMKEAKATTMPTEEAFLPYNNVTREQAPKMMLNGLMAGGVELKKVRDYNLDFSDLTSADPSLQADIIKGYEYGLVNGWDGAYHPFTVVNRAQVMTILGRALYGQLPEGAEYWKNYYKLLNTEGIFTIENAQAPIKRYELALVLYRVANLDRTANNETVDQLLCELLGKEDCKKDGTKDDTDANTGSVVVDGSATVSRVSSIRTVEVPKNATSKEVGTIKITAGKKGATVSSVVIERKGLGNPGDVASAQLVGVNNGVMTDPRGFSTSSQSATVRFAPSLQFAANETKEFKVLVSLDGDVNNTHTFSVAKLNVVDGTADGTPVELDTLKTTSYEVGTVTSTLVGGSVANGKNNQQFLRIQLTPSRDATIEEVVINKAGGEDFNKVMTNAKAYYNNKEVGKVAVSAEKVVISDLDIKKNSGEMATIELRADAVYVGPNSSVKFNIQNDIDAKVVEQSTNETMKLAGTFPTTDVTVNLQGINLTITKKSPASTTVAPGTSAVELLNLEIKSDAEFDVSNYKLEITTPAGNLDNFVNKKVTVYVNGVDTEVVDSLNKEFTSTSDRFTVEPGRPATVRVVANVKSNANTTNANYTAKFTISKVRNIANGQTTDVTKSMQGDKITIENGSIKVKNATIAAPVSRNIYANGSDLEIGRFALRAGAENVTVRKLTITNTASDAVSDLTTILSSVKLVNITTNSEVSATATIEADKVVFDGMSLEVEKDMDINVKIVVQTNSFDSTLFGKGILSKVTINDATKVSGGPADNSGTAEYTPADTYTYKLGVQAPVVTLTKKDANVFAVTIKNVDSESDITLKSISARVRPVASNADYEAKFCLRTQGSSVSTCPSTISTIEGTVPGPTSVLTLTAPQLIAKNNGEYTYEILVDSNFVDPINLQGQVTAVTYNNGQNDITEDYSLTVQ